MEIFTSTENIVIDDSLSLKLLISNHILNKYKIISMTKDNFKPQNYRALGRH